MQQLYKLLLGGAIVMLLIQLAASRKVVMRRDGIPRGFATGPRAKHSDTVTFDLFLRQPLEARIIDIATAVSDPDHADYGKHLRPEEVKALVQPSAADVTTVTNWVRRAGGKDRQVDNRIEVTCTVAQAEQLFSTQLFEFTHIASGEVTLSHAATASVPDNVGQAVELIWGISELLGPMKKRPRSIASSESRRSASRPNYMQTAPEILPSVADKLYGTISSSPNQTMHAFVNFGSTQYSKQGMEYFANHVDRNASVTYGYNNNDGQDLFGHHPDGVPLNRNLTIDSEPVLDAEVLCGNTPDQPCWQWVTQKNKYWLTFAEEVLNFRHGQLPHVFSMSYGYSIVAQCELLQCPSGFDLTGYMRKVNTDFAKFAAMGITLIISSGDDGAPGLFTDDGSAGVTSSLAPVDPSRHCAQKPSGYNKNNGGIGGAIGYCAGPDPAMPGTPKNKCATVLTYGANGIASGTILPTDNPGQLPDCTEGFSTKCMDSFKQHGIDLNSFVNLQMTALRAANPNCDIDWSWNGAADTSSAYLTLFSSCDCESLVEAGFYSDVIPNSPNFTNSDVNWKIRGYTFPTPGFPNSSHALNPEFPSSSPWVTSVGATTVSGLPRALNAEDSVVCSVWNGALITGGGGFNSLDERPSYQDFAVTEWLKKTESRLAALTDRPHNARTKRGFPDVSLVGHNYKTFFEQQSTFPFGGGIYTTEADGTSASTPLFASMISKVNSNRIAAGKPPLGFLNPLLYKIAREHPDAFLDVTKGDNKCNRAQCTTMGWEATEGWDPASGLGSINLPVFAKYAEYYHNATHPGTPPTPSSSDDSSGGMSDTTLIAVIVVVCFLGVIGVVVGVWWYCKMQKRSD